MDANIRRYHVAFNDVRRYPDISIHRDVEVNFLTHYAFVVITRNEGRARVAPFFLFSL